MLETSQVVADQEIANRLKALLAANVSAVVTSAMSDPTVRSSIIRTLEARPEEMLTMEERMWLGWCRGFK